MNNLMAVASPLLQSSPALLNIYAATLSANFMQQNQPSPLSTFTAAALASPLNFAAAAMAASPSCKFWGKNLTISIYSSEPAEQQQSFDVWQQLVCTYNSDSKSHSSTTTKHPVSWSVLPVSSVVSSVLSGLCSFCLGRRLASVSLTFNKPTYCSNRFYLGLPESILRSWLRWA